MNETILVINAGSSSLKFELFEIKPGDELARAMGGQFDGIGTRPRLAAKDSSGNRLVDEDFSRQDVAKLPEAIRILGDWLHQNMEAAPAAMGHRVVHGGTAFSEPVHLTDQVIDELHEFVPLAPLHQPNNLAPIKAVRDKYPDLFQVACFDTAFHRGHDDMVDRFAIPENLYREGVRRYGFHGLSYEFIAGTLPNYAPDIASGRIVAAHIGSGASLCAIQDGRSVDTTMGFTALDGVPMGTRPGRIDAGVIIYLMEEKQMSASAISHLLYKDCGLKGLSGFSNDVRDLLGSDEPSASLALDYFTFRIAQEVAVMASTMGGIDGLVFTAGVGENSPDIRHRVMKRCEWIGVSIDEEANLKGGPLITQPDSKVGAYVIPTDEELMIARHTLRLLRAG